jgi:hypothetical protein
VGTAATTTAIRLGWNEVAPRCNKVSNAGVSGCEGTRYPVVFRARVGVLDLRTSGWSVSVSITNLTRKPLLIPGGIVQLCVFPGPKSPRSRCLKPALIPPAPLVRLDPGRSWATTANGKGRVAAGQWVRVLFPMVTGSFESPTGPAIVWMTVHAYRAGPGGHSVVSAVGTG